MKTRTVAIAVAAVAVLAAGLLALPALAQDSSDPPRAADMRLHHADAFSEALAEELDLPVDQVRDAVTAARETVRAQAQQEHLSRLEERLDNAVDGGQLSREQADAILEAARNGVLPFRGHGRGGPGRLWKVHGGGPHHFPGADADTST